MGEEAALLAVAFGHAVDPAAAELEDAGRAVDMLALGWREKSGIQLRRKSVAFDTDLRLDRKPHRAVRCRHQRGAVDDPAWPLELRFVRQLKRAFTALDLHYAEAPRPQEA